jgi:hypothetical protein
MAASAAVIGFGVPVYASMQTTSTPQPAVNTVEDLSGNCDEAEHANDPACVTTPPASVDDSTTTSVDDSTTSSVDDSTSSSIDDDDATENSVDDDATENSVEDVSGNCDEAEHADDPECTGAAAGDTADDNSGPGNADHDNSGPGNGDDGRHHTTAAAAPRP